MSAVASWSYTAKATVWPRLGLDGWSGRPSFGAPVPIDCDYSAESRRMVDDRGIEFTTRQVVYTERADIKQGDMLLVGASTAADPIAAGAFEVRRVKRDADTFDRVADDFMVAT